MGKYYIWNRVYFIACLQPQLGIKIGRISFIGKKEKGEGDTCKDVGTFGQWWGKSGIFGRLRFKYWLGKCSVGGVVMNLVNHPHGLVKGGSQLVEYTRNLVRFINLSL